MTNKTKLKIIRWVTKLLGYDVTKEQLSWIVENKKVERALACHIYPKYEILRIDEQQIRFSLSMQMIDTLNKINAIKYTQEPDPLSDGVRVTAELMVVK